MVGKMSGKNGLNSWGTSSKQNFVEKNGWQIVWKNLMEKLGGQIGLKVGWKNGCKNWVQKLGEKIGWKN